MGDRFRRHRMFSPNKGACEDERRISSTIPILPEAMRTTRYRCVARSFFPVIQSFTVPFIESDASSFSRDLSHVQV